MQQAVSKITRPALRGVAIRSRLFRRMDRLGRKHSVAWLSAPAGSGKTTLAASWLAARRLPCLWYQIDPGDADPATFFYYLRAAVGRLAPRRRETLPLLTPEYALGLAAYSRSFFERLGARVPARTVIVLDNYQDLPEDAPLKSLLPVALTALPEGMRVLVLSRSGPPPSFARVITDGTIGFLDPEELNLSAEETRALARARLGKSLGSAGADALRARTGGWVAGTVLLLEAPSRALPAPRTLGTAAQQVLFDYFASEIFDRAPADARRLLLATAVLPEVSAAAAKALAQEPRAPEILADLVARNYFTTRLPGDEPRYRFHPLFREFLLARARTTFSTEEFSSLKRIAADKLAESGSWEDAARLLAEASAWQALGEIIVRHGSALMRQGRSKTLEEWLRPIPAEVLATSPWLMYWLGAAVLASNPAESRERFETALRLFLRGDAAAGSFLAWCGVVDTYIYIWGDFTPLDGWIAEGERLLERYPQFPSPEIEARFAYGMFCALMYRQPHHPGLPAWEERARAIALGSADLLLRASLSSHLIMYYSWWSGDQSAAALIVNRLRGSARSAQAGPFFELALRTAEAACCFFTAEHAECAALVAEGLRLAEETGVHLFDFTLSLHGCWSALSLGDRASATSYLRRMAPIAETSRWGDIAMWEVSLAWESFSRGADSLALQHVKRGLDLIRRAGIPGGVANFQLALGIPLIELGRYDEARASFEKGRSLAIQMRSKIAEYAYINDARSALRRGDLNGARASMRRHLAIAREAGIRNHFFWRSDIMSELYALALEAGIETEFVRSQIRRRKLAPPPSARDVEGWPWWLRVRALGRFELWRDGEEVAFGPRPPRKPLELLQALVVLGGEEIREDALVDCLWPEADGDSGQRAIETTLHRLRKLLGSPGAIAQSGRAMSLDPDTCWSDVQVLRRRLASAFAALGGARHDPSAIQDDVECVLRLYRGPLLPDLDTPWASEARERLRQEIARYLRAATQELARMGMNAAAEELVRRGLEADEELRLQIRSVA